MKEKNSIFCKVTQEDKLKTLKLLKILKTFHWLQFFRDAVVWPEKLHDNDERICFANNGCLGRRKRHFFSCRNSC